VEDPKNLGIQWPQLEEKKNLAKIIMSQGKKKYQKDSTETKDRDARQGRKNRSRLRGGGGWGGGGGFLWGVGGSGAIRIEKLTRPGGHIPERSRISRHYEGTKRRFSV